MKALFFVLALLLFFSSCSPRLQYKEVKGKKKMDKRIVWRAIAGFSVGFFILGPVLYEELPKKK